MATISEIGFAIDLLRLGILRDDITVLHCTTEYPAPYPKSIYQPCPI